MGVCSIRRTCRTVLIEKPENSLATCRSELIKKLKQLHKANLLFSRKIEDLIIDEKHDEAFLLKSKQLELKNHSKLIQEYLKSLDEETETIKEYTQKCAFAEDILNVLNECEKEICIEKIVESLERGDEYLSIISTQVEYENNERKQEVLTRLNIQRNRIENLTNNSCYKRRRYVKDLDFPGV